MRALLARIVWTFRRRRLVRIHSTRMDASLEGFLVGVWAGHYVIRVPKLLESEERTISLDAREARVPVDSVVFLEVIS